VSGRIPAGGGNENRVLNAFVAERTANRRSSFRNKLSDDLISATGKSCLV
jgi:hypothetical protein